MKEILVQVLTETVNAPVLRLPGRQYPGVLLQGDSLKALYVLTEDLGELVEASGEAADVANELKSLLQGYLGVYENAFREAGMDLPYPSSSTAGVS